MTAFAVRQAWLGRWTGPATVACEGDRVRVCGDDAPAGDTAGGTDVTVVAGVRDAHVHLELVDAATLFDCGLDEVHDLGARPEVAATWPRADGPAVEGLPRVRFAGQFLTAPGGYPGDRVWAPAGSVREVTGPDDAHRAVLEQRSAGASLVKITLNSDAGPVFDDVTLAATVAAAHACGLAVVAHVEGAGQTARAVAAGVDVLAHTPWTERLDDALVAAAARSMCWIGTLAIHRGVDRGVAVDNLRRFRAAGGRVRYGTDLGNGDLPAGPNPVEIEAMLEAGLDRDTVLDAMIDDAATARLRAGTERLTWLAGAPPDDDADLAGWLAGARIVSARDVEALR